MPLPTGIVRVKEIMDRSGRVDGLARFGPFTRSFNVTAANRLVGQGTVLIALQDFGVWIGAMWSVNPGTAYAESIAIYCDSIECDCRDEDGGDFWKVRATWSAVNPELLTESAIPDVISTTSPIEYDWDEWTETRALDRDKDGYPLVNTAGVRFGEPVEAERHYPLLRITRRERTYSDTVAQAYRDSVNATDWTVLGKVIKARQAKCVSIRAKREWHQTFGTYFTVSYEFAVRPETWSYDNGVTVHSGWDLEVLNAGHVQRDAVGSSTLVPIYDPATSYTQAVQWPVPLDANGIADPIPLPSNTVLTTVTFRVHPETNFGDFNFPTAA